MKLTNENIIGIEQPNLNPPLGIRGSSVAIIGASISGLSIAQLLKDRYNVTIFESAAKPGGLIKCERVEGNLYHTVGGHVLITSKSSFSYKPALMNDGIKICPRNFWHGYPDAKDWILVENDGTFDVSKLNRL